MSGQKTPRREVKGEMSAIADTSSEEVQVTEGRTTYTYNALNQLVAERSPGGQHYLYLRCKRKSGKAEWQQDSRLQL